MRRNSSDAMAGDKKDQAALSGRSPHCYGFVYQALEAFGIIQ